MDAPSTILIDKIGAEKGDDFKLTVLVAARGCALGMMLYGTEIETERKDKLTIYFNHFYSDTLAFIAGRLNLDARDVIAASSEYLGLLYHEAELAATPVGGNA